ncbi:hypothetical protein BCR43DRAFT_458719 [Syncephalastrum racemosum]|uniref:Actin-like ATPase domain-containing protein n=1 Tax=Syncephalastrum racemosum TaxID=13706 RepID=A0A1X2HEX6_SYNRA|nr:hypothetical protein BCR43DRAFT_458719 [Syncephalastrum racemosum]
MTQSPSRSPSSHLSRKLTYRQVSASAENSGSTKPEYPVTVAIDFGTTYSGCSYKLVNDDEIYDIIRWPKHTGFYAKVPTLLWYRKRTHRLVDWGDGARRHSLQPNSDGILLQQFKLWLADDIKEQDRPPLMPDQTAVEAIADYLRLFHEFVTDELRKSCVYTQDQYRYCLTVPAIWSDRAKAAMREAMLAAGILQPDDPPERLVLVSEPEAAAMYCERQCNSWDLGVGDKFMIVDAGGGTVDLIVYQIACDNTGSDRTLKELTRGHGGTCGSAYIDSNLRQLLYRKLGDCVNELPACTIENVMEEFTEKVKPYFNGASDQYLQVPAMLKQAYDGDLIDEDGCIRLTAEELNEEVYLPVFAQVLQLIEDQLQEAGSDVDAMFLVGGFGSSDYLYGVLQDQFRSRIHDITMAPRADVAVARGAIYHAENPVHITSKVLRRTYGLRTQMAFEEGLDPEDSAVVTSDGVKRCASRFDVIASKGQHVHIDSKITRSFWIPYPRHTEADLYVYDGDEPIPRQITDPGVFKTVDFPIRMPPLEGFARGDWVDITIDFCFTLTELTVQVSIAGKKLEFTTAFEGTEYT